MPRTLPALVAACAAAALTVTVAGCGPSADQVASIPGVVSAPQGLVHPGTLTVAVPNSLPPYGFPGSRGGVQGFDVDLAGAMAQRLGVGVRVVAIDPSALTAAADPTKVDVVIGLTALTRTVTPPPRFALVPYLHGAGQLLATNQSGFQPQDLAELCGHSVAVVSGTYEESLLADTSPLCGAVPPRVQAVTGNSDALHALTSGVADAYLADSATAAFDQAGDSSLVATGGSIRPADLALDVRADSAPVEDTLRRAFDTVRADGGYEQLLTTWGMTAQSL